MIGCMGINKKPKQIMGKEADKLVENLWEELLNKITSSNSKDKVRKLLEGLLSESEIKMISRRLGVIAFAKMGKSYREISETFWLSPNTISTIRKNIIDGKIYKSYRKFYGGPKRYSSGPKIRRSLWQEAFDGIDIWDLLMNPPRPTGIGLKSWK